MSRLTLVLLSLTGLLTGGGGMYLWLTLGNAATPPALLGGLIGLTCLFRIMTRNS
ncbi:MAG: hypothetical protein WCS20_12565 [Alphaproteobacteria bacterium]